MTALGAETNLLFDEKLPQPLQGRGLIHIGTSGYSFKDWRGAFYPEGLAQSHWLEFYARHFSVVEINATYYRIPSVSAFQAMVDRTPEHFEFWVKVPSGVTHKSENIAEVMKPFLDAIGPLKQADKLKGFLAQFPQSLKYSQKALDRIARLQDTAPDISMAVEFRHDGWLRDETFAFLDERGLIYVIVDLPQLKGLPKADIHLSSHVRYIRFHGRNRHNWHNTQLGDRYDYDYSETELREWLPKINSIDEEGTTAYLFFNNCHAGQAVKNARMLRQLLELELENE